MKMIFELYKSDFIGLTSVSLLFCIIILLFWLVPFILRNEVERSYDLTAEGKILKVDLHTTQSQYHYGNKIVLKGFTIQYIFQVNHRHYFGEMYVDKIYLNYSGINQLLYPDTSKTYTIKYQDKNLSKNIILIK